ncbi:MAG: oligosaccharide flippase family protein [Bacteroidetes bacterium]|nr:oligosaccharide flippase family protein [Bacteroidota bacterium]
MNSKKIDSLRVIFRKETLWLYAIRFGTVLLQSITVFIIAAFISLEEFGRFSFLFNACRIVSVVVGFGGSEFLIRELAYGDAKHNGLGNYLLFKHAFLRSFYFTGILLIIVSLPWILLANEINIGVDIDAILANSYGRDVLQALIIIICSGYLYSVLNIIVSVVRVSKSATFSLAISDCLPYLFFLIGFTICLMLGASSANMLMVAFSASLLLCCCFAFYFAIPYLKKCRGNKTEKDNKEYYTFWGISIVGALIAQSDVLIAKIFLDDTALGVYALLRRASNLISLPQVIVNWAINIEIAREYALKNLSALQKCAHKGLVMALPVATLMVLVIVLLSPFWFDIFKIEQLLPNYLMLIVLMFGQLVNVMSGANLLFASLCKQELFVFKSRIFSLLVGYITMAIGALYYGNVGFAVGSAVTMLLLNIIVTRRVKKKIGVITSIPLLCFG